jgi:mRNA-degrading endonuclease RelE of RelBE toxin-antitoxin system
MTYQIIADPLLQKKLRKLFRKDKKTYEHLKKKLTYLGINPEVGKPLRNVLKNKRRLHMGSFVLIYNIDNKNKIIKLLEFEHHDRAYK